MNLKLIYHWFQNMIIVELLEIDIYILKYFDSNVEVF